MKRAEKCCVCGKNTIQYMHYRIGKGKLFIHVHERCRHGTIFEPHMDTDGDTFAPAESIDWDLRIYIEDLVNENIWDAERWRL